MFHSHTTTTTTEPPAPPWWTTGGSIVVSAVEHPQTFPDLVGAYSSPKIELVHTAREALFTAKHAAALSKTGSTAETRQLAQFVSDSAQAVERDSRILACRVGVNVSGNEPFLPNAIRGFDECGLVLCFGALRRSWTGFL